MAIGRSGSLSTSDALGGGRRWFLTGLVEVPEARGIAISLGAAVFVVALGATNGGYFPSAWGWSALAFSWIAAIGLALRPRLRLRRVELAFLGSLAGFTAWSALAATWSPSPTTGAFVAERNLVYLTAAAATLIVVRRRDVSRLLAGTLAGIVAVDLYAFLTRVLPDRLVSYDPTAEYRLSTPIGYWNGLGILSTVGILLALGFTARARRPAVRGFAAATLPLLATTLYFTFSRGALLALAIALVVVVAYDPRRLQLVAACALPGAATAAAIVLASRSDALTTQGAALAAATRDGHALAWKIALLCAAAGVLGLTVAVIQDRVSISRPARLASGLLLAVCAAAVLLGVLVHYGGPVRSARNAWDSFTAAPVQLGAGTTLDKRLFSLSSNGRIDLWHAAWHEARAHPVFGGGSGSYQQWWLAHRSAPVKVENAHNLYLETLAELGPVGLALLLVALALPLAAAIGARRHPLAAAALGGYIALLVHAVADWDWQLPAVVVAAIFCGCSLFLAGRRDPQPVAHTTRAGWAAFAFATLLLCGCFVVLVGNVALGKATGAANAGDWTRSARDARTASRWMPWSAEPWRLVGEAELARRQFPAARRDLRKAIAKDSRNWQLWYDLAAASTGSARSRALSEAKRLNPLSPEIAEGL